MQKLSRTQYGLEQQIMEAIFQLRNKKNSQLFREPVDPKLVPDYYQKIAYPMDLQTILVKLKQGKYNKAEEVLKDLQQITTNCHAYNIQPAILKKAQKFEDCIKTQWGNFKKQIKKKGIDYNQPISHSQQIKQRLIMLEEKKKKRRTNIIQLNLMEDNKKSIPQMTFLPPLGGQTLYNQERIQGKYDLPPHLTYKPQYYAQLSLEEKKQKLVLDFDYSDIDGEFQRLAQRKLEKYRKVIYKKVMWIQEKIIQKCLQKKRFKKMQIPNHLSNLIEGGQIAKTLQIRKLQMYVKQVAYWIEQYSHILGDYMKDKFVDTCRCIRRCLLRVLRYKKIPKTTKIHIQSSLIEGMIEQPQSMSQKLILDDEMKNYENRMKQFRRMLMRDIGESTKRDTKIIIRNDGGQFVVVDWNSQNAQKRKRNKQWNGGTLRYQHVDAQEVKNNLQKKEEIKRDQEFISQYKKKSNIQIILKYNKKLEIDWDLILMKKIPIKDNLLINFDEPTASPLNIKSNNGLID